MGALTGSEWSRLSWLSKRHIGTWMTEFLVALEGIRKRFSEDTGGVKVRAEGEDTDGFEH